MHRFTADLSAALPGPPWLRQVRADAMASLTAAAPPSEAAEVWRYSRIDDLDLDSFAPFEGSAPQTAGGHLPGDLEAVAAAVGDRAALVVTHNGVITRVEVDPALSAKGLVVGSLAEQAAGEALLGSVADRRGFFLDMAVAFGRDAVTVDVPAGLAVERPVVVLHWVDADDAAVFPRTIVRAAAASEITVIDHVSSADVRALVVPVVELDAGPASNVRYLNVQELGRRAWQVGYQASRLSQEATLASSTIALGGDYARVRADSRLEGPGATTNLTAVYFGDGGQMHDFRTMQDHAAPKTTSNLLFKGAVAGEARSVYTGLIRVAKGAAGTTAFQTNRNLVLAEGAQAYSVPNLEIDENEVSCSHASAVGPIDAEQQYYLEARGIPTATAERLIVLGFFDEVLTSVPSPGLRAPLRAAVAAKLDKVVAGD